MEHTFIKFNQAQARKRRRQQAREILAALAYAGIGSVVLAAASYAIIVLFFVLG